MAYLTEGYQILINLGGAAAIHVKTLTPPAMQNGDAIDVTSQDNATFKTKALQALIDYGEISGTCSWDPVVYHDGDLRDLLGVNASMTITFPDGSTLQFWGGLVTFEPGEFSIGEEPVADFTIVPTLRNASGVETAPVYTAPA
jgi:hypothetical protein